MYIRLAFKENVAKQANPKRLWSTTVATPMCICMVGVATVCMHSTCISENSILFTVYLCVALSWWLLHCASVCSNNVLNFSQNFYWLIIRFITKILQATETDYNYLCMKCLVTIIIMSLWQNWWEGQSCMMTCSIIYWYSCSWLSTDNIFLMVSLRACATAANKHKIWIKSSSKKRWQRLKLQSCISAELYRQTIMHASCS